MKIAIVHHQYAKKGGLESYLLDLIKGFGEAGDTVKVFTYKVDKKLPIAPYCSLQVCNLNWLPKFLRKYFFVRTINRNFNREYFDLSLSLARTASQDISVCGGTHRGYLQALHKKTGLKDRIEIYLEQKSFDAALDIIAHSQLLQSEIEKLYGIDPKKIHMLYPPIDTDKFNYTARAKRSQLQKKWSINPERTTLLFPSTGHKRKGWPELLAALSSLPENEFELLVAGNMVTSSLPKNVRCLGFVENMAELYAAVDFTVLPSHYEPFGLVVVESLQCGTPVIISDQVGAKDLIGAEEGVNCGTVTVESVRKALLAAREKTFNIDAQFAERHGLTLAAHIQAIKALVKR
jgi:glycosyltransferase involved in cell wall biosynthesis